MEVYYFTQVLEQGINNKTMCSKLETVWKQNYQYLLFKCLAEVNI